MVAILGLAWMVLSWAAITDWRERKIPNRLVLTLLALWVLARPLVVIADGWQVGLTTPLICALIALVAGFALFAGRIFGAGDAKLFAVLMLWASSDLALTFLLVTALSGGALAMLFVVRALKLSPAMSVGPDDSKSPPPSLPYGIALWAGGSWVLAQLALS